MMHNVVQPALCCFSAGPFCSGSRQASDWIAVTRHILPPVSILSSPSRLNTNHLPPQRVHDYPSQPFTAWQTSAPHVTQTPIGNCTFSFSLWHVSGVLKSSEEHAELWKAGVICWLKTRRPCGMTRAMWLLFSNTLSSHEVMKVGVIW